MKYVLQHSNDPTKFKIESHKKEPKNALAKTDLEYSDAQYITSVVDGVVTVDEVAKATDQAVGAVTKTIGDLYDTLNSEVLTDMALTFETSKPESALTNYIMYIDMQANPGEYADKGLKAPFKVMSADGSTLFGPGDLLNTNEKVLSFASRKLELSRAYGIRRLQKIDAFIDDKNDVLGV